MLSLEGGNGGDEDDGGDDGLHRAAVEVATPSVDGSPTRSRTGAAANELLHLNDGAKLVIGMVGLPARGKSHVRVPTHD